MRASGSALRAAATATSSSLSRCAASTRRAFWPMEPVAPSRTTRFLVEAFATGTGTLLAVGGETKAKKQIADRRSENEAVGEVECPADAGDKVAGVLDLGPALDDGLDEVGNDGGRGDRHGHKRGTERREVGGKIRAAEMPQTIQPDEQCADTGRDGDA